MRARSATIGAAADVLAQRQRQPRRGASHVLAAEQISRQEHGLALGVRHLDADHVAAGHGGDAHRGHRQAARHVVGQPDHAGAADARRRFQFVQRHHRAGPDLHDRALHAVIGQHGLQQPRIGLQRLRSAAPDAARAGARLQQTRAAGTASRARPAAGCPGAPARACAAAALMRAVTRGGGAAASGAGGRAAAGAAASAGALTVRRRRVRPRAVQRGPAPPRRRPAARRDAARTARRRPPARAPTARRQRRPCATRLRISPSASTTSEPASAVPSATPARPERAEQPRPAPIAAAPASRADRAAQPGAGRPGERPPCQSGTPPAPRQHRQRRQQRGQPQRHAAQAAMRADPPRPGQHRQPGQRAGEAEALQQQVRHHRAGPPGQVGHRPGRRRVERRVAGMVGDQRHQQRQRRQRQGQRAQFGDAPPRQRVQRRRGKAAGLGSNGHRRVSLSGRVRVGREL